MEAAAAAAAVEAELAVPILAGFLGTGGTIEKPRPREEAEGEGEGRGEMAALRWGEEEVEAAAEGGVVRILGERERGVWCECSICRGCLPPDKMVFDLSLPLLG